MDSEVVVIGAGTAGLIAAKRLGGYGISTTVYERKAVPGIPVRASGILSLSGLASLGISYRSTVTNTLTGAIIHAGSASLNVDAKEPIAVALDRRKLSEVCLDEAKRAGATIKVNSRESVSSYAESGKIIVGADGAVSDVAKHFKMGAIGKYALTYKATFAKDCTGNHMVELFFDNKVVPGLFGWLCPNSKDELEVGIGIESGKGNAKGAYDLFLKKKEVSEAVDGAKLLERHASVIPMRLREHIVNEGHKVLLVGDAAGQVKPSTGGGIIFGGNGAILAADTINNHLKNRTPLSAYEKAYLKKYGKETRLHSIANKLYGRMGERSATSLITAMNVLGVDKLLGRIGEMDMPSQMLRNLIKGRPKPTPAWEARTYL